MSALTEAVADALNVAALNFKSGGWGSNPIDQARLEALGWVMTWLRDGSADTAIAAAVESVVAAERAEDYCGAEMGEAREGECECSRCLAAERAEDRARLVLAAWAPGWDGTPEHLGQILAYRDPGAEYAIRTALAPTAAHDDGP